MSDEKWWMKQGPFDVIYVQSCDWDIIGPDMRSPRSFSEDDAKIICLWMNHAYIDGKTVSEAALSAAKLEAEQLAQKVCDRDFYNSQLKEEIFTSKSRAESAEAERDRIKQAADHMADALKMARMAFEKNWAIDWNILDRAIEAYESALGKPGEGL